MKGHRTELNLQRPQPLTHSYWVGASREQLIAASTARRHQQRIPTDLEMHYDPMVASVMALLARKREGSEAGK